MFGIRKNEMKVMHVNEIDSLVGKVELIDIRENLEYKSGTIKSAKNIPMGDLLNEPKKYLNTDKTYYILCQSGGRSAKACSVLTKQGFNVVNVSGGVGSYVGTRRQ
jgi:rhodanese-related sulfurtransferase